MAEFFDYSNVFLVKSATELLKHMKMNDHIIQLKKGKKPLFGLIYCLGLVGLETLKTYIKIKLANGFITSFKSPTRAFIFFN